MQKHLFIYAGIFGALILAIFACLCYIAWMVFFRQPQPAVFHAAEFVKEVLIHAAV